MKREQAAFICQHVFDETRPVLLVAKEGGDWQLLCGDSHEGRPRVVGLNHLLERDPSLRELMDLQDGWEAERAAPGSAWHRREIGDG